MVGESDQLLGEGLLERVAEGFDDKSRELISISVRNADSVPSIRDALDKVGKYYVSTRSELSSAISPVASGRYFREQIYIDVRRKDNASL